MDTLVHNAVYLVRRPYVIDLTLSSGAVLISRRTLAVTQKRRRRGSESAIEPLQGLDQSWEHERHLGGHY